MAGQSQPSTFSMCMTTIAMHAVVIESELYISYVNFKALHAAGNASLNYWSRTEWAWMRVRLSFWGASFLVFSPHLFLSKSWGVVVVVVSCGCLIVVPLLLLHPIISSPFLWTLWMNVAWKASIQLIAGNWLNSQSWELYYPLQYYYCKYM